MDKKEEAPKAAPAKKEDPKKGIIGQYFKRK